MVIRNHIANNTSFPHVRMQTKLRMYVVGKLTFFSPQFPTNILSLVLQSFASSQSLIKEKSSNRQLLLLILSRMANYHVHTCLESLFPIHTNSEMH